MISLLILSGLVNTTSHPIFLQSSELIITLAHHYVLEEKDVRNVTRDLGIEICPNNIEKVWHLLPVDQF